MSTLIAGKAALTHLEAEGARVRLPPDVASVAVEVPLAGFNVPDPARRGKGRAGQRCSRENRSEQSTRVHWLLDYAVE